MFTDAEDDEDGDDVEVAEVDVVEDASVDEVRDPEAGDDAEYGEERDPQRARLEPDEREDERQTADSQHDVFDGLAQHVVDEQHVAVVAQL